MLDDFKPDTRIFWRNMFRHFDKDKDGFISLDEFKELSLFYDENNETNKYNLVFIDDLKLISKLFEFIRHEELNDEFKKIDSNRDGKISLDGEYCFSNLFFKILN